jgi:hypothetical protein
MDSSLADSEPAYASPLSLDKKTSIAGGAIVLVAVFLSAALLFLVEPMFGKMVLPLLGGSPAVWTTCMLFFQGALLLGYLYAHVAPRWLRPRWHKPLHIALLLLSLLALPIGVQGSVSALRLEHPTGWLLWVLTLSVGAPFTLLSSTAPLLQLWFSKSSHPDASNPYFLYAASNAGSILGLVSYPFIIEPMIGLPQQSRSWTLGYLVLVVLVILCATLMRSSYPRPSRLGLPEEAAAPLRARTVLHWVLLAFVPSSFFLALTTYLTTDVAAVPLLWIIPLALYLLSFVLVFGRRTFISRSELLRWQPVGLIALVVFVWWGPFASAPLFLPFHVLVFFVTALICHGELALTKPPASQLTEFYLWISVGGVLGGLFNALLAPALFNSVLEYPLTLVLACAVRPRDPVAASPSWRYRNAAVILVGLSILMITRALLGDSSSKAVILLASGLAAFMCLRVSRDPLLFTLAMAGVLATGTLSKDPYGRSLLRQRNFFGVREVREDTRTHMRVLTHGTTKHGAQSTEPARRREPMSYYYRGGPVGDIFEALSPARARRVAIIGLGTGGLTAYSAPGESWTFYEIDPDIARLAESGRYFTYLKDALATINIVVGDGRLSLASAPDHQYDLIVIDAFSSDAIPIHLLTREAMSLYLRKLASNGVLVLHLSNRYLDLEPVVARLGEAAGLTSLIRVNTAITERESACGADPSIWAALASRPSTLGALGQNRRWRPLRVQTGVALWTDNFSNIFKVFHLPHGSAKKSPAARVPVEEAARSCSLSS